MDIDISDTRFSLNEWRRIFVSDLIFFLQARAAIAAQELVFIDLRVNVFLHSG